MRRVGDDCELCVSREVPDSGGTGREWRSLREGELRRRFDRVRNPGSCFGEESLREVPEGRTTRVQGT